MSDLRRPPEVALLAPRPATGVLPARPAIAEEPSRAMGVRAIEHVLAAGWA